MNVKQLKKKWVRGYANKELRKLPIDGTGSSGSSTDGIPFILKIEHEPNTDCSAFSLSLLVTTPSTTNYVFDHSYLYNLIGQVDASTYPQGEYYNSTHSPTSINGGVWEKNFNIFYNLRDINNQLINKNNRPDLFTNKPYHIKHGSLPYEKISSNLIFTKLPFFKIDWGDGTITEEYAKIQKSNSIIINEETFYYDIITLSTANGFKHQYEDGLNEHIIKIYGQFYNISFSSSTVNVNYVSILQWGKVNLLSIAYLFSYSNGKLKYIADPKYLDNVVIGDFAFQEMYYETEETYLSFLLKFLKQMPKLVSAYMMCRCRNLYKFNTEGDADAVLMETDWCLTYLPERIFKNNKELASISYCFEKQPIDLGESPYAFSDMPELITANYVFGDYITNSNKRFSYYVTKIADGIFKNCPKLINAYLWFSPFIYSQIKIIGNEIFKGCKSLLFSASGTGNVGGAFSNLEYVGNKIYENCESMVSAYGLFQYADKLFHIGNDIFKGCKNIRFVGEMFFMCNSLENVPDNFLADIQTTSYNDRPLVFAYKKTLSSNEGFPDTCNFFWKSSSENTLMTHMGKNFLPSPSKFTNIILVGSGSYAIWDQEHYSQDGSVAESMFTGEAPKFWLFNTNISYRYPSGGYPNGFYGAIGHYQSSSSSGTGITFIQHWDNISSIPKDNRWMVSYNS